MFYTLNTDCNERCLCRICMLNGYCSEGCCRCSEEETRVDDCTEACISKSYVRHVISKIKRSDKMYARAFSENFKKKPLMLPAPKNI